MWDAAGRGSSGPETAGTEAWRWDGLGSAEEWSGGWYDEQGKDGGWYPEWERQDPADYYKILNCPVKARGSLCRV